MVLNFFSKLFDSNEKEIQKFLPLIDEINSLEKKMQKLKDTDFAKKTKELKERVASGESLDLLLPESFALSREAARRSIGQRHYDVQLMAAIALSQGKIAEQKTGEGKTLSAVPALFLHSLTGKNVHLVTVNDYLARRDAGWMGPVFHLLGVSVSALISEESFLYDPSFKNPQVSDPRLVHLKPVSRQEAYKADIVYGINSEFGFDYLRDNMAQDIAQVSQRGHYFAIVDEVDSVLIDEARTPHIISAPDEVPTQKYYEYAKVVEKLSGDTDYKIDEKLKTAHLTEHGLAKIEKLYGVANIYEKDFDTVYHLEAALKARTLFHKEKEYIVKDNEVILVDEFTGRLMVGRRLSEGLHQAIEAKENVPIQKESKTLATVSLQNYFRMYEKLGGMTGTAVTEAEEFSKIYKLDVVVIPTNNPIARKDFSDAVYKTTSAKITAVVEEIATVHKTGQPILVGTTSIEKNEILSSLLKRKGIAHTMLNAKNHLKEAEIIAKAGEKGAVTVATNMAGRGVDIVLGGQPGETATAIKKWQKSHDEVIALGGLYIIGTERHESRRIDNQLRGRAGRQGDPGTSKFFVSLDDEIMRLFGGDTIAGLMTRFNMPDDTPLEHPLVSRAIESAQVKVEGFNFDSRKHLVEYDDVLNKQREIIYALRRKALQQSGEDVLQQEILQKIDSSLEQIILMSEASESQGQNANEKIIEEFVQIIPFDDTSQKQLNVQLQQLHTRDAKGEFLKNLAKDLYANREKELGKDLMRQIEKYVVLSVVDSLWVDHLDAVENLRQGIGLRGYGQRDPLVEYKNEAFRMFEQLVAAIDSEVVRRIYRIQVQQNTPANGAQPAGEHEHTHTHKDGTVHTYRHSGEEPATTPESVTSSSPVIASDLPAGPLRSEASEAGAKQSQSVPDWLQPKKPGESKPVEAKKVKIGRNDPCWCGSGKKYKKCHYPN
ncbi:MAG TPA: preprotein translocase subunit SecA [Candidatus Eisenbacteria bacterium]|nr:preprotein translocase subunit SecA [Candidatus Eisenbacteria bacterium]